VLRSILIRLEEIMLQKIGIVLGLGIVLAPMSHAVEAQERPQIEIGRYQVVVLYNSDQTALLVDTVTGRSWILSGKKARTWSDLNYGQAEGNHLALTPPPCTQDNPTCYFGLNGAEKQTETKAAQ